MKEMCAWLCLPDEDPTASMPSLYPVPLNHRGILDRSTRGYHRLLGNLGAEQMIGPAPSPRWLPCIGIYVVLITMGGACSRKRGNFVDSGDSRRGGSPRFSKAGSSKWLLFSLSRCGSTSSQRGQKKCPSLMELCVTKIREDIAKYSSFSMLPRDISQQIFNELVKSYCLTDVSLDAFRDCALQDMLLGEYPGVKDGWMPVISSQGSSLLSLDISCSDVTDAGFLYLKECPNVQLLNLNYCDQISDHSLDSLSGKFMPH
ncbi:hypothetical protein HPP92_017331 [Vanilla planifolia]|uniref:Uncharacterized protein n=1 Tax=Vanilla planifolia TaxID=51239 RepID=A0A835QCK7_VANPL|nr:hypothetical protein HPP92_017331 [Vanilla planifolia]